MSARHALVDSFATIAAPVDLSANQIWVRLVLSHSSGYRLAGIVDVLLASDKLLFRRARLFL